MSGATAAWYRQVGFVVAGDIASLILAHDLTLALYNDAKTRSALAVPGARRDDRLHKPRLWLLSQANA